MADELAWRDMGLGLAGIVTAVVSYLYKGLTGRVTKQSAEIESIKTASAARDQRLALLEQKAGMEHIQLMQQISTVGSDMREWRDDSKSWRADVVAALGEINRRLGQYDQDIAASYRENTHPRRPSEAS